MCLHVISSLHCIIILHVYNLMIHFIFLVIEDVKLNFNPPLVLFVSNISFLKTNFHLINIVIIIIQ